MSAIENLLASKKWKKARALIHEELVAAPSDHWLWMHLGLTYYFYSNANCTASTCALNVGFISSLDGGTTWTAPTTLAGPMTPTYRLPDPVRRSARATAPKAPTGPL